MFTETAGPVLQPPEGPTPAVNQVAFGSEIGSERVDNAKELSDAATIRHKVMQLRFEKHKRLIAHTIDSQVAPLRPEKPLNLGVDVSFTGYRPLSPWLD